MATAIARVGGIALAPGVSKNRRLYTKEAIAKMVARAQGPIQAGQFVLTSEDDPVTGNVITQLTHHAAEDDSTKVVGRVTSLALDESGRARFSADIAPTSAGRDIASLLDTSDGQAPFLRGVSIRGRWVGTTKVVKAPDGEAAETGDDLELLGLDYTHKPGVPAAAVDTFAWAKGGQSETSETVLITESVQEAHVATITEDATPVSEAGTPPTSQRDSGLSGSGRAWADPGYQKDKKQRYDISTKAKAKAAWSYINQAANAKLYTPAQLKRVKGRIKSALGKFGVTISTESAGWLFDSPEPISESVMGEIAEYYGDPDSCGSYSLCASNGPTELRIAGYGLDPAELQVILQAAANAACLALKALDPDMDGDIDVPGAPNADNDADAGSQSIPAVPSQTMSGETAPDEGDEDDPAADAGEADEATVAELEGTPAPEAAAGETTEGEPVMTDSNTAAESAPAAATGLSQADVDAAVQRALSADRAARKAAKAARRAAAPESAPAAPVAETAPAAPAAATESEDAMVARMVNARLAEQFPAETDEQRIQRKVAEAYDATVARMVQTGQIDPSRKGLVVREAAGLSGNTNSHGLPSEWGDKPLHQMSQEEFDARTGPVVVGHVLGARAALIG